MIESHPGRGVTLTILLCTILCLGLIACNNTPNPTPFPTVIAPTSTPITPTPTNTPIPLVSYTNSEGGFALDLPENWSVADRGVTPLGRHFLFGVDPSEPGPTSSAFFIASANRLTAEEAARALLCGECDDEITFEEAMVGELAAQRTIIANEGLPPLVWHFVEVDERLYFFSIHDPITLADRADIINTLVFSEPIIPTATPTVTPTPTPTATPIPPLVIEPVNSWRRIEVDEAGLSFEVPADWDEAEDLLMFEPETEAPAGLAFTFRDGQLDTDPLTLVPESDGLIHSATLELSWAVGVSYTIAVDNGWERHVVIPAGTQIFNFYTYGLSQQALNVLEPVLLHTLESVRLDFVIERYLAEPTDDVAVPFFEALVDDPAGDASLLYLTQDLRNTLTGSQVPLDLLELPSRLVTYNIEWTFSSSTLITLETTITMENGEDVVREFVLVFSEDLGWRINAINLMGDDEIDS